MRRIVLLFLSIFFGYALFVYAQTDTRGLKLKLRDQAAKRWAIIIGVNNYDDTNISTLKKASNDAWILSKILEEQGEFKVYTFTDVERNGTLRAATSPFFPTKQKIERFLSNIEVNRDIKPDHLVLFAFSGHGVNDAQGNGYLLPFDADLKNVFSTAIAEQSITKWLRTLNVRRSLVLLDACRSALRSGRSMDRSDILYQPKFENAQVSAVFYSSQKGKVSYEDPTSEYGAFTRFVVTALQGKGDLSRDGLVTFRELQQYVEDGLTEWALSNGYDQRPYIKLLEEQSGDLALTISGQEPAIPTAGQIVPFSAKKDADYAPEMVYIPGGEFMMGSNNGEVEEKPVHRVRLNGFWIGKHEVTQREWQAVMGNNPSYYKGEDLPVETVSWDDVQVFLQKLSQRTGKKYRLPTEAEWEYACRAGSSTAYSFGDDDSHLAEYAWHGDNSNNHTHPVGQKKPNTWGLCDMHGNVWEWCADWYDEKYYAESPADNPQGPATGSHRVLRGGGWYGFTSYLRSANRFNINLYLRIDFLGFRCLQDN